MTDEYPAVIPMLAYEDAVAERAQKAGATILSEVESVGVPGKRYRAEDLEGHRWMFMER